MKDHEEALRKMNGVRYWRHRVNLGNGCYTPGETLVNSFGKYGLNDELKGKSFLDIGAWDGYHCFKAEEYGASRVVATDVYSAPSDNKEHWGNIRNGDEGIRTAKEILNSPVEIKDLSVYDLSKEKIGTFDVVHFAGVLYHLRHPLLALEIIGDICKEFMILESACVQPSDDLSRDVFEETPLMSYRGGAGWFPNKRCIEEMVKLAGFGKIEYRVGKVIMDENDRKFGIIKGSPPMKINVYGDETGSVDALKIKNKVVVVLNTELGDMDITDTDAKWLRIQDGVSGSRQFWVPKESVEFVKAPPQRYSDNRKVLSIYRIHFLAYK